MHKFRRVAPAAVVALIASAFAFAAEPTLLKCHQKEGDKAVYTLAAATKSKLALAGKATAKAKVKSATAAERVQMKCGLDFTKVIGMGRMQIGGRILEGTAKVSSQGKSETKPMGGLEEQYVVTALGEVRTGKVLAGEPVVLPFSDIAFGPDEALPPSLLPDHAVKVGDTWSGSAGRVALEGGEGSLHYVSRVLAETSYAGRSCLRIKTEARGSARGELFDTGLANRVPAKINVTATDLWLFDPVEGIVLKCDTTGTFRGVVAVEGVAASLTQTTSLESHLRLVAWNGQPVEAK